MEPLSQAGGFYSTYFLVKKKGDQLRPVLEAQQVLEGLTIPHVDLLTLADVLRTIAKGEWFTSVDLKDAYFHVPIVPHHRWFLTTDGSTVLPLRAIIFSSDSLSPWEPFHPRNHRV